MNFFKVYKWGISLRLASENYLFLNMELGYRDFIEQYAKGFIFTLAWFQSVRAINGIARFRGIYWTKIKHYMMREAPVNDLSKKG